MCTRWQASVWAFPYNTSGTKPPTLKTRFLGEISSQAIRFRAHVILGFFAAFPLAPQKSTNSVYIFVKLFSRCRRIFELLDGHDVTNSDFGFNGGKCNRLLHAYTFIALFCCYQNVRRDSNPHFLQTGQECSKPLHHRRCSNATSTQSIYTLIF